MAINIWRNRFKKVNHSIYFEDGSKLFNVVQKSIKFKINNDKKIVKKCIFKKLRFIMILLKKKILSTTYILFRDSV